MDKSELEKRVEAEAEKASARYEQCNDTRHSMAFRDVVRPLVTENDWLRSELKFARDAGAGYADALTISQDENKALRAEAERLKGALTDANEVIKDADEARRSLYVDLERERATVRDLLRGNDALETTVRTLAALLKGQS